MRCLIVDDEPLSIRIIEKYIAEMPNLQLVATANNAFEAMESLKKDQIDLLFLDINMPKLSGISLLKSLSNPPMVIFTTAYPEYAVEGFELEAVDYLLKPFSIERFIKAVHKAEEKYNNNKLQNASEGNTGFLIVKADKKLYKLNFRDIIRLQAYGDYVRIYTKEKSLITKERLANLEKELPNNHFIRIHRSHIISQDKIEFIEGNMVKVGEEKLPVSLSYRESLMKIFK